MNAMYETECDVMESLVTVLLQISQHFRSTVQVIQISQLTDQLG